MVEAIGDIFVTLQAGEVKDEKPLIIQGDNLASVLSSVNYDVATRLRDSRFGNGVLVTFHRDSINLSVNDNVVADGVPDEAGVFYDPPNLSDVLGYVGMPLPAEIIDHIKVRLAAVRMGVPLKSGYELFKEREDNGTLGFGDPDRGLICPDNMVIATCTNGKWSCAMALPYANLSLSPNMQALHYGSAAFEGMTCEIGEDGNVYVFGMEQHYERIRKGAVRLGVDPISWPVFEKSIMLAVQQNARFIPKFGKGRLYIRPHFADIGPQMRVGNSKTTGFFVEVTPIGAAGAYFGSQESVKEGVDIPMKVLGVPSNRVRTAINQGDVKSVGGYAQTAPVIKAVRGVNLKKGENSPNIYPDGVLYLDRIVDGLDRNSDEFKNARVCESNASNTFFIKNCDGGGYELVIPTLSHGDILPGNTRNLVISKARELGWEVTERDVLLGEVIGGEFSCAVNCGTAAMISNFDAIQIFHIYEQSVEGNFGVAARTVGGIIEVRSQKKVNAEPNPEPVQVLLKTLMDVKSGASSEEDKAKYLTMVHGLRARS